MRNFLLTGIYTPAIMITAKARKKERPMTGNNYQIIGLWRNGKGKTYFGFAQTREEAEELIAGFKTKEELDYIGSYITLDRRS